MKTTTDFFEQASGLFLTENLDYGAFDDILNKGEVLPVSEDYENWDPDYLEGVIEDVAFELLKAYRLGEKSIKRK